MKALIKVWEELKRVLKIIGDFNARVILTIFYFFILGPLSLIVRIRDPLVLRKDKPHGWIVKSPAAEPPLEQMLRQW